VYFPFCRCCSDDDHGEECGEDCELCREEEEEMGKIVKAELSQVYSPAATVASIFLLAVTFSLEYHINPLASGLF